MDFSAEFFGARFFDSAVFAREIDEGAASGRNAFHLYEGAASADLLDDPSPLDAWLGVAGH